MTDDEHDERDRKGDQIERAKRGAGDDERDKAARSERAAQPRQALRRPSRRAEAKKRNDKQTTSRNETSSSRRSPVQEKLDRIALAAPKNET